MSVLVAQRPTETRRQAVGRIATELLLEHLKEKELREDFNESDHPRDDAGRFVAGDRIEAAKTDHAMAEKLRAEVTDPDERAKLEAELGGADGAEGGDRTGRMLQAELEELSSDELRELRGVNRDSNTRQRAKKILKGRGEEIGNARTEGPG